MLGIVGQRLRVGNHNINVVVCAAVLQLHAFAKRADVMTYMQSAGGAIACENYFFHVILRFFRLVRNEF